LSSPFLGQAERVAELVHAIAGGENVKTIDVDLDALRG
jgi:hypothetical protein